MRFLNRIEAGRKLAKLLKKYAGRPAVVWALPRGGAVIGQEIASFLRCPLSVLVVKKIGHPQNPEYAIGAVSASGQTIFNAQETRLVDKKWLAKEIPKKKAEARRRMALYLKNSRAQNAKGKIAIIADDGIATGLTMLAAIREIKKREPKKIIVAVPVSSKEMAEIIGEEVAEFVALKIPPTLMSAIGAYYEDFEQVSDSAVIAILKKFKI